jgi:hypothetical protein
MNAEPFDPLKELSLANEAITTAYDEYAVPVEFSDVTEKIDGVIGSLSAGHGNDFYGEVRFALVNLGRMIAAVQSEIAVAEAPELVDAIGMSLDALDAAINEIPDVPPGPK